MGSCISKTTTMSSKAKKPVTKEPKSYNIVRTADGKEMTADDLVLTEVIRHKLVADGSVFVCCTDPCFLWACTAFNCLETLEALDGQNPVKFKEKAEMTMKLGWLSKECGAYFCGAWWLVGNAHPKGAYNYCRWPGTWVMVEKPWWEMVIDWF